MQNIHLDTQKSVNKGKEPRHGLESARTNVKSQELRFTNLRTVAVLQTKSLQTFDVLTLLLPFSFTSLAQSSLTEWSPLMPMRI